MVLLESEKKVRRRCWCGSKIQTATLPDGNTTTDFQNWRVSFGAAKPKRKRTKVVMGLTKEAIEADRTGGYLHERLLEVVAPQNLFGADYYFIEYRMPEAPFTAAKDKNKRLTLEQRYMSDEIDLPPTAT
ncbi:hypothetical protein JL720_4447 [Aureococcus anophagefferens]|nr:hypothetical protein JL720_4447 [Aureococcus anophagefferens]